MKKNLVQTKLNFTTKRKADSDPEEEEPKKSKMSKRFEASKGTSGWGRGNSQHKFEDQFSRNQHTYNDQPKNNQGSSSNSKNESSFPETQKQPTYRDKLIKNAGGASSSPSKASSYESQSKQESGNHAYKSSEQDKEASTHPGGSMSLRASTQESPSGKQHSGSYSQDDSSNVDDAHKPKSSLGKAEPKVEITLEFLQRNGKKMYDRLLPDLKEKSDHTVLGSPTGHQKQTQLEGKDCFEFEKHAYLPNLSKEKPYSKDPLPRWQKIEKLLKKNIPGVFELEETILSYNEPCRRMWNFDALIDFLQKDEDRKDMFFLETLPEMQKLALKLPDLFKKPIPLLKQRESRKITMTQEQAACLLANAFFCTFPKRSYKVRGSKMPDINFSNLYSDRHSQRKQEKLKCIFNYFQRVTKKMPVGTLTFTRQSFENGDLPEWKTSKEKFTNLFVSDKCTIEGDGKYMLQADFANKYIGGGVLGHGLVQEEIRFMLCPELIVARLFTECLLDKEVLIMTGCEQFSSYTGYSDTFKFESDFIDDMERDSWNRHYTEVVAMDALVIKNYKDQFDTWSLIRELNKAYCAFSGKYKQDEYDGRDLDLPAVCTGNWGCGAFGGDKQLKALIQLMAAAQAKRDVCYFTFGDDELSKQLKNLHEVMRNEQLNVRNIFDMILCHQRDNLGSSSRSHRTLFDYMLKCIVSNK